MRFSILRYFFFGNHQCCSNPNQTDTSCFFPRQSLMKKNKSKKYRQNRTGFINWHNFVNITFLKCMKIT